MSENVNIAAPHDSPHHHERELGIPPTLDSDGRCLVCGLEEERRHMLSVAADLERERNELKGESDRAHHWRDIAFRAGADREKLRDALYEAVKALVQHRTDMHQASSRPCSTCAFSEKVLAHARTALDYTYRAEVSAEPPNTDKAGE